MVKVYPSEDNTIFALDIGTRSVIGIVALVEAGRLRIIAQCACEHENRAMYDGQVHDIPKVAGTVLEVKRCLENKIGFGLGKAAIAAAGRSLVTRLCRVEMQLGSEAEVDAALVNGLEIAGVKTAQQELLAGSAETEKYYCVGHSVVRYYLNDYPITSLIGHRASKVAAEVLATFLPESVVNGLYAVLHRAGLEPLILTLEPIAAIEVAIPEGMRLLNLALVDIGAGTSDIAITRKGSVVAYGMVPVAGDEITEAVAEAFLLDFEEAERVKRLLAGGGEITCRDILGDELVLAAGQVLAAVEPAVDRLAGEVASAILELNGGEPPRSVFCVGGGSRLPGLAAKLAGRLGVEERKVAVRGREVIRGLAVDEEGLEGPEGVTVVGIGSVAVKKLARDFIKVIVDGREFSIFSSKDLTVAGVLAQAEFNPRDLIGYHGRDLKFTFNGQERVIYGTLGRPAEIYVNGQKASLKTPVKEGDEIVVQKAVPGEDARIRAGELAGGLRCVKISLNGEQVTAFPVITANGARVTPDYEVKNGDCIEIKELPCVGDLLNGGEAGDVLVEVNGEPAGFDRVLNEGDEVRLHKKKPERVQVGNGAAGSAAAGAKGPAVPGPVLTGEKAAAGTAAAAGAVGAGSIEVTVNGRPTVLSGRKKYLLLDVLNYVDINRHPSRGRVVLKLNGRDAGYMDELKDKDRVEIYWETE